MRDLNATIAMNGLTTTPMNVHRVVAIFAMHVSFRAMTAARIFAKTALRIVQIATITFAGAADTSVKTADLYAETAFAIFVKHFATIATKCIGVQHAAIV